ncbi:MAG: METTL5 family protein [Nanoarchaeota archaeon]|nr:METTL5 family protein [Nanoarchaeota archaeon]
MTKSQLAIILSKLKVFTKPNVNYEQYPTDSEVAASILWAARMNKDITGKVVADLGCGTGILGIGALILRAKRVVFVDKDEAVLKIAEDNLRQIEDHIQESIDDAEFVNYEITDFFSPVDVVIMNPPFGTRNPGADKVFLERAMKISRVVYSIHKASTKEHIRGFIERNNFRIKYEKEFEMPIKNAMKHHTKKLERISVICFGIEKLT